MVAGILLIAVWLFAFLSIRGTATEQGLEQIRVQAKNSAARMQEPFDAISAVSTETSAAAEEVSASTEEMSAQVSEIASAAEDLARLSEGLASVIRRFSLQGKNLSGMDGLDGATDETPTDLVMAGANGA